MIKAGLEILNLNGERPRHTPYCYSSGTQQSKEALEAATSARLPPAPSPLTITGQQQPHGAQFGLAGLGLLP